MTIILFILKILLTIFLVILAVAVALVLIVLFVPIRYSAYGRIPDPETHDEFPDAKTLQETATGNFYFHWLLYLVRGGISYPEDPSFTVKVLGFTVFRKDFTAKEEPENPAKVSVPSETDKNEEEPQEEKPQGEEQKEVIQENTEPNTAEPSESYEPAEKVSLYDKVRQWIEDKRYQWRRICVKIKHIVHHLKYYWNIISSPEFADALDLVLRQLKKLLPRDWSLNGTIGLGDPESAGTLLEAVAMLYPVTCGHVNITPEFYKYRVDVEAKAKGRIRIITIVIVLLDRNVIKVIRGFLRKGGKEKRKHG